MSGSLSGSSLSSFAELLELETISELCQVNAHPADYSCGSVQFESYCLASTWQPTVFASQPQPTPARIVFSITHEACIY